MGKRNARRAPVGKDQYVFSVERFAFTALAQSALAEASRSLALALIPLKLSDHPFSKRL
jgi:hypothetical protein